MKKILALILVISCVFALGSCKLVKKITGKDENKDQTPSIDTNALAGIQAKIDASVPETAHVTVAFTSSLGKLNSEYNVTYLTDGTATVTYSYEKFNTATAGSPDNFKEVLTGETAVLADGTLTSAPEGIASVEALTFDINLDSSKLYSATVTSGMLTATVKAENTAAVLGVDLGVDADIIITTGSLGVTSVAIHYVSASGPIEIVATYTYYVAPEEDPEAEGTEDGEESTDEGATA